MKFAMSGGRLPAIDLKKTGQNITRMRKEVGISVRELQVMFGFTSPQAIYNWQNGISLPSVDNFIVLAAILGVTIDEILVIRRTAEDDLEDDCCEAHDEDEYEDPEICPLLLS